MNNKKVSPVTKEKKAGPGSNPENKFKKSKKSATSASLDNIITPAVESVKAKSGRGSSNAGKVVSIDEELK